MATMRTPGFGVFSGVLMTLLAAIGVVAPAFSQQASRERALARSVGDGDLQWGPCPAFFPKGCEIAALHGDPARPNADIFFRVPPH